LTLLTRQNCTRAKARDKTAAAMITYEVDESESMMIVVTVVM
jgi:hypothetical protein